MQNNSLMLFKKEICNEKSTGAQNFHKKKGKNLIEGLYKHKGGGNSTLIYCHQERGFALASLPLFSEVKTKVIVQFLVLYISENTRPGNDLKSGEMTFGNLLLFRTRV